MKHFLTRVEVFVVRVATLPVVVSAARHAVTAAGSVYLVSNGNMDKTSIALALGAGLRAGGAILAAAVMHWASQGE